MSADEDRRYMLRAVELALRGEGRVEPNPMVGCVIVRNGAVVGEGWHRQFGGPHAEVEALRVAGEAARGSTAYVTLEPCCHQGKTAPCTQALIAGAVRRVVVAQADPNPVVNCGGLRELAGAGVLVDTGAGADEAAWLLAPFAKLTIQRRPWVIAKWAMTLDGKLATRAGDSKWISGEESRAVVHALRGRVDAVVIGRGTAEADDPLLTARPAGPRVAARIVLDSRASLSPMSQLVCTVRDAPVIVAADAADAAAPPANCQQLRDLGVEVWQSDAGDRNARVGALLDELGRRHMTNILVEGGAKILGAMFDLDAIDEVHVFVAPRLAGGDGASPLAGRGVEAIADAGRLTGCRIEQLGDDAYIRGRIAQ